MNSSTHGRSPAAASLLRTLPITLLATLALAGLAVLAAAAPANAAAYRYWSYWQGGTGTWVAAQTGPADHALADRDVQGWRFALTTDMPNRPPDNAPDFAALCPDLAAGQAPAGQLRVAVVIDSGFAADAPEGQVPPADAVSCVTLPERSTGNQALAAAATVLDYQRLVCAVNGYPEGECGAEVSDADAAVAAEAAAAEQPNPAVVGAADAAGDSTDSGSPTGFILGAVVLVALLGAAYAIPAARRRRRTSAR